MTDGNATAIIATFKAAIRDLGRNPAGHGGTVSAGKRWTRKLEAARSIAYRGLVCDCGIALIAARGVLESAHDEVICESAESIDVDATARAFYAATLRR